MFWNVRVNHCWSQGGWPGRRESDWKSVSFFTKGIKLCFAYAHFYTRKKKAGAKHIFPIAHLGFACFISTANKARDLFSCCLMPSLLSQLWKISALPSVVSALSGLAAWNPQSMCSASSLMTVILELSLHCRLITAPENKILFKTKAGKFYLA